MSSKEVLKIETTSFAFIYSLSSSEAASCLRKFDAVKKTTIDTYFSTPKAGTMLEVCKSRFGLKAVIDKVPFK